MSATQARAGVQTMRHESELGRVEFMRRPPHRLLGRFVHGYTGFDERVEGTMRRRELPSGRIPLILNLGPTLEVSFPAERSPSRFASFAAGMHTAPALTAYEDASRGVQVDLTPLGARMLFGLPMAELANRVVGLDELLGRDGSLLVERLADVEGWEGRIDLLEAAVARRLAEAPPPPTEIQWAWQRLERSGGDASIGELSEELGWSRRRLGAGFRDQVGVPPKTLARIFRFERACARIRRGGDEGWGEIALACGFYDQAHFNRDFREFAATTPTEYMAARLPDGIGVSG